MFKSGKHAQHTHPDVHMRRCKAAPHRRVGCFNRGRRLLHSIREPNCRDHIEDLYLHTVTRIGNTWLAVGQA